MVHHDCHLSLSLSALICSNLQRGVSVFPGMESFPVNVKERAGAVQTCRLVDFVPSSKNMHPQQKEFLSTFKPDLKGISPSLTEDKTRP